MFAAFALVVGACNTAPSACDRLGQAFCEAAGVDCAMSKKLFAEAELPATKCEEAIVTLREVLPMLSPDPRGHGLTAFLREVMRDSPKMSEAQLDALSQAVGLMGVPAAYAAGPQVGPGADPAGMPQNVFSGYGEFPDPPEPAPPPKQ